MFEELFENEQGEPEDTEIKHNNKMLRTGDVYAGAEENTYLLVVHSKEMPDKFALVTNHLEGEHLLQYPKNQELLTGAVYLGNIYFKGDKKAQDGFDKISEFWNTQK